MAKNYGDQKVRIARGLKENIPDLDTGELGLATDTNELFIGNDGINLNMKEYVSVKDFGAKGDGETDDTEAIQNAIDYADNNNKIILLPSGEYNFTNLDIKVSIIGQHKSTLNCTGNAKALNIDKSDITLRNCKITSDSNDEGLLNITSNVRVFINNCTIEKSGKNGIIISGADNSINIANCNIIYNEENGIYADDIKRCNIINNYIGGNKKQGVYIEGYNHGLIINANQIWGNDEGGIYVKGDDSLSETGLHSIINSNQIDHNQDDDDSSGVNSNGITLDNVTRFKIINNLLRSSKNNAIEITNSEFVNIIGNISWKNGGTGLSINDTNSRFNIIGNNFDEGHEIDDYRDHSIFNTEPSTTNIRGTSVKISEQLFFKGDQEGEFKRYASGGGMGNTFYDTNAPNDTTFEFKNSDSGSFDIKLPGEGDGIILTSDDGSRFKITVDNNGDLQTTEQ